MFPRVLPSGYGFLHTFAPLGLNFLCNTISKNDYPMNRYFVCLEILHKLEVYATLKRFNIETLMIRMVLLSGSRKISVYFVNIHLSSYDNHSVELFNYQHSAGCLKVACFESVKIYSC